MTRRIDRRLPVHVSFEAASRALRADADSIVTPALGELRLALGESTVTREVVLSSGPFEVDDGEGKVRVSWRAARHPHLFPVFEGELQVRREGWMDIELRLVGEYRPPLWFVGEVGDRVLGHRVAGKTIDGFLSTVAKQLLTRCTQASESGLGRTILAGPNTEFRDERRRA
jgi:hypothetical protein